MSGNRLVVDTNVLIYLTSGSTVVANLLRGKFLHISCVTEMEMLSWPSLSSREINRVKLLIAQCKISGLLPRIKEVAVGLRRKYRLKLPDAIIASTARVLRLKLVLADKQFAQISDLDLQMVVPH